MAFVSAGVVLATLSRPSAPRTSDVPPDAGRYTIGVIMLTVSLFLTGALGVLQERTYTKYGPHWKEGVFYTVRCPAHCRVAARTRPIPFAHGRLAPQHFLSLPIFLLNSKPIPLELAVLPTCPSKEDARPIASLTKPSSSEP